MKSLRFHVSVLVLVLFLAANLASQEQQVTSVRVIAYEYYEYYGLPDTERWRKVESIKIEGQNRAGSVQAYQSGPDEVLEVTLHNVSVPSEYWVTVTWQEGGKFFRSHTAQPQRETVHHIYQP